MCTLLFCILTVNSVNSNLERTLDAICAVESSNGKDKHDGDSGAAIGPYQIHRAYWIDGTLFLGVRWPYSDARDPIKARQVVRAYLTHYQRASGYPATPETWAKIHNGGPHGPDKASTVIYWRKVQIALKDFTLHAGIPVPIRPQIEIVRAHGGPVEALTDLIRYETIAVERI